MKHKLLAQNKRVIGVFDRAKRKMYKRYERTGDLDVKKTDKSLSYSEYYSWLETATQARNLCLDGKISEGEVLRVIKSD